MMRLVDISQLNPKIDKENTHAESLVSFVPMASISEVNGSITSEEEREVESVLKGYTYFQNGDILVAKITPCFENGKIALAHVKHEHAFGSTEFHVIRPDAFKADGRYLFHFLRQPRIRIEGEKRMTGSGGQRRVPKSFLEELEISLPSLPEQRRIAAILDKAEALRSKRREAIAKLDQLLQSVFLEMFGGDFLEMTVEKIAKQEKGSIRTGPFGSQLLHSEFTHKGVTVLGIDNAVKNSFQRRENRFISNEKYQSLSRYRVYPGDIIITIMGTCGRCAIVPNDIELAINTKHLCCITLNQKICLPEYLHSYFLMHPLAKKYLFDRAKGAIMDGLNMGIIKEMPVSVPPIKSQEKYREIKIQIEKQKKRLENKLEKIEFLVLSLHNQFFTQ